jgi:hypothetical protein
MKIPMCVDPLGRKLRYHVHVHTTRNLFVMLLGQRALELRSRDSSQIRGSRREISRLLQPPRRIRRSSHLTPINKKSHTHVFTSHMVVIVYLRLIRDCRGPASAVNVWHLPKRAFRSTVYMSYASHHIHVAPNWCYMNTAQEFGKLAPCRMVLPTCTAVHAIFSLSYPCYIPTHMHMDPPWALDGMSMVKF